MTNRTITRRHYLAATGASALVLGLGLRMTPPRGDNWAGCLGMTAGAIVYCLRTGLGEVVASLVTEPVTEDELARAKALLTTAWWRQVSTVGGRADTLSRRNCMRATSPRR